MLITLKRVGYLDVMPISLELEAAKFDARL
jgi:hypothetical protein